MFQIKPQHASRPISTAMANEPPPQQLNPRVPIKRLDFEGKSMACLVKERACFALMEALSRFVANVLFLGHTHDRGFLRMSFWRDVHFGTIAYCFAM